MLKYELHTVINGAEMRLNDGLYPKSFSDVNDPRKPKRFATAGGVRNYAKKWGIRNAKAVKVNA